MASQKKSSTSKSVKPPKDRYFKHPEFLKNWHASLQKNRWLRGGILALILLTFTAGLIVLTLRLWEPPPLSKLLPETTLSYREGILDPGAPPLVKGLGPKVGEVFFAEGKLPQLQFYTFTDKQNVEQELLANQAIQHAQVRGRYFVIADSDESLEILDRVQNKEIPSLHYESNFLKMRPNLNYHPEQFRYESSAFKRTSTDYQWLETPLFSRHDWLDAPLEQLFTQVFTSTGQTEDGRTYTVGDKSFIEGAPLFHFEKKYQGDLLKSLPETVENLTAGQDLVSLVQQFAQLLNRTNGLAGTVMEGLIADKFHQIFPENLDAMDTLNSLFSDEYAWATTADGDKILLLNLSDEAMNIVGQLSDVLLQNGFTELNPANGNLRNIPLEAHRVEYQKSYYDLVKKPTGEFFLAKAIRGNTLILTTSIAAMEQALTAFEGGPSFANTQLYDRIDPLVQETDHLRLTPGHILTFNGFDDGILTHQLLFGP